MTSNHFPDVLGGMKTLSSDTIDQITKKLSHFLADTFVLYVKTLNFHWNMVGKEFYMYHRLLQEQYEEMQEATDELAERIRMLGREAPGTMKQFLEFASLKEASAPPPLEQMVLELVENHEEMVAQCHETIQFMDKVLDQGTSDLLVERIRFHSKQAWLLRSHLN
ncbi:MAG: DNA protection during starvation protein 2 [Chlamydiales bacterium]|nr:DNA protection during starvation protein 2 [Chlamydiales bacterium]